MSNVALSSRSSKTDADSESTAISKSFATVVSAVCAARLTLNADESSSTTSFDVKQFETTFSKTFYKTARFEAGLQLERESAP